MATTILPKKSGFENPFATDDEAHEQLVADPTVTQFHTQQPYESYGSQPGSISSNNYAPAPVLTAAGENAAQNAEVLVSNTNDHWINHKWRPAMGWMYMLVCTTDFVIFPVLWSVLQAISNGKVDSQWQPITLQGAGLFHIAMGAILGIAVYGRTKEKIENIKAP